MPQILKKNNNNKNKNKNKNKIPQAAKQSEI